MFRGTLFRTSVFRGTSLLPMLGTGTLNVEDYKNYRSRFLLIADTGANFMLNGEIVDGTVGVLIKNAGYYEAVINGPDGNVHISHFCYWRTAVAQISVVSEAVAVSDMDYRKQTTNRPSNMVLYHDSPLVAYVAGETGSPMLGGIVGDQDFYRTAQEVVMVRILPSRHVHIYDDPVIWQASYPKQIGYLVRPTVANGCYYRCTTAGTTHVAEPTWPTTAGATVADNTAVWTCVADSRELHYYQKITTD